MSALGAVGGAAAAAVAVVGSAAAVANIAYAAGNGGPGNLKRAAFRWHLNKGKNVIRRNVFGTNDTKIYVFRTSGI
jgi:hypothetical protein